MALTLDHTPDRPEEQARILAANGSIFPSFYGLRSLPYDTMTGMHARM